MGTWNRRKNSSTLCSASAFLRARRTPPEEKLLDGPRLFDLACRIMKDGIRDQYPDADDRRVQEILAQRLEILRRLEESA